MKIDVSTLSYGILALSNPAKWPNEREGDVDYFITGKDAYIWALIVESYIVSGRAKTLASFDRSIEKIGFYAKRYFEQYFLDNPPDFSDAGVQFTTPRRGLFQSVKNVMGTPIRSIGVGEAGSMLSREFYSLERKGFIVDPLLETLGGATILVLGAIPYSFTKRTESGDRKYLQIKALLWEFEKLSTAEKEEVKLHLFMEKAIERIRSVAFETAKIEKKTDS